MKYKLILFSVFCFFRFYSSQAQDTLGFSADLYKYLIKNDDFNKDGILSQSEINYVCCVQIKNFESIKGISKLRNLKFVTIELGNYSLDELFKLKEVKRLTIKSENGKRRFSIPGNCKFLLELTELSISDCIFDIEDYNIYNLRELYINSCEVNADVSKFFDLKSLKQLTIRNSIIKSDINIKNINTALVELSLHSNNFSEIPNTINKVKRLKSLSVTSSNLNKLPENMGEMDSLKSLYLSENNFDTFPDVLLKLKSLKYLSLHTNKKQLFLPKNIDRLIYLENIPISINYANGLPEEIFNIKNLKKLVIYNCNLQSIPEMVFNLTNLEGLTLQNCRITEISPNIVKLINLKELNLSNNKISIVPKLIENLKNLKKLYLSYNQITNLDLNYTHMENLEDVNLNFNKLQDFPYSLGQCKRLEHLNLSNNNISKVDQLKYGDFNRVYEIQANYNPILNIPDIFQQKINTGIKYKEYDSSMNEPFNNLNIVEEILTPQKNKAIFTCNILAPINDGTKFKFMVKILDCFCGVCDKDSLIINSNRYLEIGTFCIINGQIDVDHNTLYCNFNYYQISTPNLGFNNDSYLAHRQEYFDLAEQMAQYRKDKYSGMVTLKGKEFHYAEGEFVRGEPHGKWKIYFAHKETSNLLKSELNFLDGKLHGDIIIFVFNNGNLQKKFVKSYNKGTLQKSEEFKYSYDKLYTIEGKKFYLQHPFQITYNYIINPDNLDTLGTSSYFDVNHLSTSNSVFDDFVSIPSFPHGKWQYVNSKELKTTGEYFKGMKVGLWYSKKLCCSDTIAIYDKPKINNNIIAFHENGKPMIEGSIIGNKKQGKWRVFSEEGVLIKSISFENDIISGIAEMYYPSEILRRKYIDGKFINEVSIKKENDNNNRNR